MRRHTHVSSSWSSCPAAYTLLNSLISLSSSVRLIVVLNGTDQWEEAWAHANLSRAVIIGTKSKYFHHTLLNLFLRDVHQPFGIVDFDCFVFRPDYFRVVEAIGPATTCQAFHASHNPVLDLWMPERRSSWC